MEKLWKIFFHKFCILTKKVNKVSFVYKESIPHSTRCKNFYFLVVNKWKKFSKMFFFVRQIKLHALWIPDIFFLIHSPLSSWALKKMKPIEHVVIVVSVRKIFDWKLDLLLLHKNLLKISIISDFFFCVF